jgi:hypothetical protein
MIAPMPTSRQNETRFRRQRTLRCAWGENRFRFGAGLLTREGSVVGADGGREKLLAGVGVGADPGAGDRDDLAEAIYEDVGGREAAGEFIAVGFGGKDVGVGSGVDAANFLNPCVPADIIRRVVGVAVFGELGVDSDVGKELAQPGHAQVTIQSFVGAIKDHDVELVHM